MKNLRHHFRARHKNSNNTNELECKQRLEIWEGKDPLTSQKIFFRKIIPRHAVIKYSSLYKKRK